MNSSTQPTTWLCVLVLVATATAQGRERRAPVLLRGGLVVEQGEEAPAESGVAVRMFESPTLDRFLRKAQDFLGRGDHTGAIKVLQDVLEGNIHPDGAAPAEPEAGAAEGQADAGPAIAEDDPTHAVFSGDQRLYRPVRRLCHELLAALPEGGLALYGEMFEVAAERAYRDAVERRDLRGLEGTSNRYFATLNAARALYAAGDLLMHEGRYRAAIQTYRVLLEVYPAANRARVPGLSDVHVRLRIALCFAQMGETAVARELLQQLGREHPGASVRLGGELVPVADLHRNALFARAPAPLVAAPESGTPEVLRSLDDGVVPVWQFHYTDPEPYRRPAGSGNPRFVVEQGASPAAPWYNRHGPGTSVHFDAGRLVFMDHFRLRVHDLGSGLVSMQTEEADRPPKPRQGKARVRIPVYDFGALRVAHDERRYYCVVGPRSRSALPNLEPILRNQLVAYDRATLDQAWSSGDWKAAEHGYGGVTFLATPTVFGQRLLVPVLVQGAYALQGIAADSGEPLFRVHLHSGGTELARAPSVPVVVTSGTAYVLTNAGTVAAVDAYTGELRWVRRYERTDPNRPTHRRSGRSGRGHQVAMRQYFRHVPLPGFVPSDLIAFEGRIVLAPSDGEVLLCLDGASGELLWVVDKPGSANDHVVGHNGRHLFVGGSQLMCVDLRTGIRLWSVEAPESAWTGRGLVTDDRVVLPGSRCLYTLPLDGRREWRTTPLPAFSIGVDPQAAPANLFVHGPYLVACYEGGIEVYASLEALHELAQAAADPVERADLLVQAGDLLAALDVLGPLCLDEGRPAPERKKLARRALALVRDVALARASHAAKAEALGLLDRTRPWFPSRDLALQWQLLRIELFQALGEADAVEREQDVLYQMMEGRR